MGFRGRPSLRIFSDSDDMTGGRERQAGSKSSWVVFPQIAAFSSALADFSVRQLPSASVGFRGLSSPHILLNSGDITGGMGMGPKSKVPGSLF